MEIHAKGVIHADIKAANMIADVNGNDIKIKTVDYDFSMILPENKHYITDIWKGTPKYMAPEILTAIKKAKYSMSSDIYALGRMFILDLKLPAYLFTMMLHDDPEKRCSIESIILKLVNILAISKNLNTKTLQFIEQIKAKYDPNYSRWSYLGITSFLPGFTDYLKQTASSFCNKAIEIPIAAKNYFSYYFPK